MTYRRTRTPCERQAGAEEIKRSVHFTVTYAEMICTKCSLTKFPVLRCVFVRVWDFRFEKKGRCLLLPLFPYNPISTDVIAFYYHLQCRFTQESLSKLIRLQPCEFLQLVCHLRLFQRFCPFQRIQFTINHMLSMRMNVDMWPMCGSFPLMENFFLVLQVFW